jgi:hypothetical protein
MNLHQITNEHEIAVRELIFKTFWINRLINKNRNEYKIGFKIINNV